MTQFDLAAAALVLVFGYSGYRRGLLVFVLNLTGGVLAFALAAVLAPVLAPAVARAAHLPPLVAQPVAVIGLTAALRLVFGYAMRELAQALRVVVRAIPPLALLDRVLGIVPGMALGGLVVVALAVAALSLPVGAGVHGAVASSWLARNVVTHPAETLAAARKLWDQLVVSPPHIDALPLAAGVGGLWVAAFAAFRARSGESSRRPFGARNPDPADAETLRAPRLPTAANTADPFALPRVLLGLAASGIMAAALIAFSRMQGR